MKYYVRFCNKFEGNKIPDTFAAHYISAIYKGPNATSFTVAFGDEVYLLTNGYLFKSIFNSDSNGNSFTFDNVTFAPERLALSKGFISAKYTAFHLLAHSGLRKGECFALTWADVNFEAVVLRVNKAVGYSKKRGLHKNTKTSKPRVVDLDKETLNIVNGVKHND